MWPALIVLDHKQPATPLKTDNYTIEGFVKSGMKPKRSKMWDMKWHWLRYTEVLDKIRVYWNRGTNNDTDYLTKHHPPIHHRQIRTWYIHTSNLARTIYHTIILCEGVLNQSPVTHYRVDPLKAIRSEPQYMTRKGHMFIRLNWPQKHIM